VTHRCAVHGELDDNGEVRLATNIRTLDPCLHGAVIGALATHAGYDPVPLQKALIPRGGKGWDARWPDLPVLMLKARMDWDRWGTRLVEAIHELLEGGNLLPMSAEVEAELATLLREHEVGLVAQFSGQVLDQRIVKALKASGDVDETSTIELAFRLGLDEDPMKPATPKKTKPTLRQVVKRAMRVEVTPQQRQSMRYAQRQAGIYMRKAASEVEVGAERTLNEAEQSVVRETITDGVEKRWGSKRLARELRAACKDKPVLQNNMERVARTEIAFAHSHGAYRRLKAQALASGDKDPQVYKLVSPMACTECRRIWGPSGAPIRYRLSAIEARDAAGGNFNLKRDAWGPVIGPVHPHCTEGPLLYFHDVIWDAIQEAREQYKRYYGG